MAAPLHTLLLSQLGQAKASPDAVPDASQWAELLRSVSDAYQGADEAREERDRLDRELEIPRMLQTSLLPQASTINYLDIVAHMTPAAKVGGDYYDIIPVHDACWVGIGDVSGHGLHAAIIMVMLQSMVAALVRATPDGRPSRLLARCNEALWAGLRERLRVDDHISCTLLRCMPHGHVEFAGAHEDILISRAGAPCERIQTPGTWLGITPDIETINTDQAFHLRRGDVAVLYTDGLIEAMNDQRRQFGTHRLSKVIDAHRDKPVADIRDAVLGEVRKWTTEQRDDLTLLVMRYRGT